MFYINKKDQEVLNDKGVLLTQFKGDELINGTDLKQRLP